ncbi:MAG: ClpXP protease specificity-enhancing factor SspB [Pseudomonadota bacterium]
MTDFIGYDELIQAAQRGVVRDVLERTAKNGAPQGDHHFYISFRTKAPGVKIADHLVERFPEEMTIVIQHQYWDLEVADSYFEIILKFSGVPQHLHIPFSAITRFVDPSVNFGLSFEKAGTQGGIVAPVDTSLPAPETSTAEDENTAADGTVVNLDAFRRK